MSELSEIRAILAGTLKRVDKLIEQSEPKFDHYIKGNEVYELISYVNGSVRIRMAGYYDSSGNYQKVTSGEDTRIGSSYFNEHFQGHTPAKYLKGTFILRFYASYWNVYEVVHSSRTDVKLKYVGYKSSTGKFVQQIGGYTTLALEVVNKCEDVTNWVLTQRWPVDSHWYTDHLQTRSIQVTGHSDQYIKVRATTPSYNGWSVHQSGAWGWIRM